MNIKAMCTIFSPDLYESITGYRILQAGPRIRAMTPLLAPESAILERMPR